MLAGGFCEEAIETPPEIYNSIYTSESRAVNRTSR